MEKRKKLPLSGDMAYQLFTSSEPFPLSQFLDDWKDEGFKAAPGYIIAVIQAYTRMQAAHDGPRDGTYRPSRCNKRA